MLTRRATLMGFGGLLAAPAIARAGVLMPVRRPRFAMTRIQWATMDNDPWVVRGELTPGPWFTHHEWYGPSHKAQAVIDALPTAGRVADAETPWLRVRGY